MRNYRDYLCEFCKKIKQFIINRIAIIINRILCNVRLYINSAQKLIEWNTKSKEQVVAKRTVKKRIERRIET